MRKVNRILNAMTSWDPPDVNLTMEMVTNSFQTELLYSRTSVYFSEDMVPFNDTNSSTSTSVASNLISLTSSSSLQSHWSTCLQVSSALNSYSMSGQVTTMLDMLGVAARISLSILALVDSIRRELAGSEVNLLVLGTGEGMNNALEGDTEFEKKT